MKSFFMKVQSIFGDEVVAEPSQKRKIVRGLKTPVDDIEDRQELIQCAAQCLSDALQEILNDISSLSGEKVVGFHRLLKILSSASTDMDVASVQNSNGVGCLQVLIDHMHCKHFVEICNRVGLASALLSALRLLRMLEIKRNKLGQELLGIDSSVASCDRVCKVFQFLCTDSLTVEQIRSSLVKLFTFPLSVLPLCGVHIQEGSAEIIAAMCRTGFTSQQVWYLHDVQVMMHMIRNLQDLVEQSGDESSDLLRGESAERAGMWIIACRCIVDVVVATKSISSVLLGDFESAGGNQVFLYVLRNSSMKHFPLVLNIVLRLLSDPFKGSGSEDILLVTVHPNVAIILEDYIKGLLNLSEGVANNVDVEYFMETCRVIKGVSDFDKEYAIQCLSYSLLTIYSNEPLHCIFLEDQYHILPLLIIAIPILKSKDSISAILTTLNYICQCVENCATLALTALCGAIVVVFETIVNGSESSTIRELNLNRLSMCYSSFEAIVRSNSKYSLDLLKFGLLRYAFCEPFEKLCTLSVVPSAIDHWTMCAFQKNVSLISVLTSRDIEVANEIRSSGLCLLITSLIGAKSVSYDFMKLILVILEDLSKVNDDHLGDSIETLLSLLLVVEDNWSASRCIVESLVTISVGNSRFFDIFASKNGSRSIFSLITRMKFLLATHESDVVFKSFESTLRFLSMQFHWINYGDLDCDVIKSFALAIIETEVFVSKYSVATLQLMVDLLVIADGGVCRRTPLKWMELLIDILPTLDQILFDRLVESLGQFCSSSFLIRKILNSGNIVSKLLSVFPNLFCVGSPTSLLNLIRVLTQDELTVNGFSTILTRVVKQIVLASNDSSDRLPLPWESGKGSSSAPAWLNMQILKDLAFDSLKNGDDGIPFLEFRCSTRFKVDMNGCGGKNIGCFTFSSWMRTVIEMDSDAAGIIPLFSLFSTNTSEILMEVHFDTSNGFFRVLASRSGVISTIRFKPAPEIDFKHWNLFSVTYRKPKRFTSSSSKSAIMISVNGLNCVPSNSEFIEMDFPTTIQAMEVVIGAVNQTYNLSNEIASGDRLFLKEIRFASRWRMGSCYFFDECLSSTHLGVIFAFGPKYSGSFGMDHFFRDNLPCISSDLMRRMCVGSLSDSHLEAIGLSGIDMLFEPRIEGITSTRMFQDFETLPAPLFAFHFDWTVWKNTEQWKGVDIFFNSSTENRLEATISNVEVLSHGLSFADCVACLGGPIVLFPLCQCASNDESLCGALNLLKCAIWSNFGNLKFMQAQGYKTLAFILGMKPRNVFTSTVIECLFSLTNAFSQQFDRYAGLLLVDTAAFYYLILNFQIWGDGRFSLLNSVAKYITLLVSNERFGGINAKRLSCLGTTRWLLIMALDEIHRYVNFCEVGTDGKNEWNFPLPSSAEMAEYRDCPIIFLQCVSDSLQRIISAELRRKDIDLIVKIIFHSFCAVDLSVSVSVMSDCPKYPFCDYDTASCLSPLVVFRVYLLRLLFALYDTRAASSRDIRKHSGSSSEIDGIAIFRQALSPTLMLTLLEKSSDSASRTHALRLLGLIFQNDSIYQKDFCQLDGMRILVGILAVDAVTIPVILPIISMFFRIPMQLSMFAFQIKSVSKFIQILELDECLGPDVLEPNVNEVTLPTLEIFLNFICSACQCKYGKSGAVYQLASDLLFGVLNYGLDKFSSLRQLLQRKKCALILLSSVVGCSNAGNDFGSAIYDSSNGDVDLSQNIFDEYLDSNFASRVVGEEKYFHPKFQFAMLGDDGDRLLSILFSVLQHAICEFDNSCCLCHFFSYAFTFPETTGFELQKQVWTAFQNVVREVLKTSSTYSELFIISNNVLCTVPLSRGGSIFSEFNFECLSLCLFLLDFAVKLPAHGTVFSSHDRMQRTIKELGGCSRYFAFACIHGLQISKCMKGTRALVVFSTISRALDLLFHAAMDDSLDLIFATTATRFLSFPQELEKNSSYKKANQTVMFNAKCEKQRISSCFFLFLVSSCCALVLEDDTAVRIEATRILAYLSNHRRVLMEQLFSNSGNASRIWRSDEDSVSSKEVDIFRDGFAKLVPNSLGKYDSYFSSSIESLGENSELNRFADFSYWLSDNNGKCERVFHAIDTALQSIFPDIDDQKHTFSDVDSSSTPAMHAVRKIERADEARKLSEYIFSVLNRWSLYGLSNIAAGALLWHCCWHSLQCSPIWGYSSDGVNSKSWCLSPFEGPERMRRKIEQDYSFVSKNLKKNNSNKSSETVEVDNSTGVEMESLVRSLVEKGLIKKVSSLKVMGNVDIDDTVDLIEVNECVESEEQDLSSPSDTKFKEQEGEDNDIQVLELPLNTAGKQTDLPQVTHTLDSGLKSLVLHEIVKGLIGSHEWNKGVVRNVRRIYGLETQRSMLIISDTCIHLLRGFALVRDGMDKKNSDCILSWYPSDDSTLQSDFFDDFVKNVWKDLLDSDSSYIRLQLSDVRVQ